MRRALVYLLCSCLSVGAWASSAPLSVRNMMPVAQLYGLPRALGAQLSEPGTRVLLNFEITNNFESFSGGGDDIAYDGETYLTSLTLSRALGARKRFELGVEIPYISHRGGHLDGFIEEFHDIFGFPDGGRSEVPRNMLNYRVQVAGTTYVDIQDSEQHLADLRAWLGYQVWRREESALALRGMLKAPTGKVSSLSGSGATDVALWAEYVNRRWLRALRLEMSLMAGVVLLGNGDLAPAEQRDVAGVFHFGLQLPLGQRIRLHGQLDAHTALVDAAADEAGGGALQGTLGGRIALGKRFWLDLGVVENLTTQSSPDVTFQILLGGRLH